MTDREQILREQTGKGDGKETRNRVYDILVPHDPHDSAVDDATKARNDARLREKTTDLSAKLLALLVERLQDMGHLSAKDVDDLLFDLVT